MGARQEQRKGWEGRGAMKGERGGSIHASCSLGEKVKYGMVKCAFIVLSKNILKHIDEFNLEGICIQSDILYYTTIFFMFYGILCKQD